MSVESTTIRTRRGDEITVTMFKHCGEEPTVMLSVIDADDTKVPTAEFTLREAGELREVIRRLCERAVFRPVPR